MNLTRAITHFVIFELFDANPKLFALSIPFLKERRRTIISYITAVDLQHGRKFVPCIL